MYFNASFQDVYCKGMGCSIPHAGICFPILLFIMNWSNNGLIEKSKLVTWRPINCVVHDSGWNTYTGKY